jgi:hypothetical protein
MSPSDADRDELPESVDIWQRASCLTSSKLLPRHDPVEVVIESNEEAFSVQTGLDSNVDRRTRRSRMGNGRA